MLLETENLSFAYPGGPPVLAGISFAADAGKSVGLIGANGAGKSTLLKLLVGLEETIDGRVSVDGQMLSADTLPEIRRKTGYVFQDADSQLFMTTVAEDVAFAPRNYGLPEEETARRTGEALRRVHLEALAQRPVWQLSGGEKKLASIATVLSMDPQILLFDEPSAGLDPANRRNLIHILNELSPLKIIASHDLDFIYDTCSRVILLFEGKIIADGRPEDILRDRALLETHGLELPLSVMGR